MSGLFGRGKGFDVSVCAACRSFFGGFARDFHFFRLASPFRSWFLESSILMTFQTEGFLFLLGRA